MRILHETDLAALELLIDRYSIAAVLMAVSEISSAKAEHVATDWQDAQTAKLWTDVAFKVGEMAEKVTV